MARAESASAAPVSLDCEQADRRKWLGERQLQQRTEFCWGGRGSRENFNRNSSSVSKLKIKLYHKGQCDQAQLTIFSFPRIYQHLVSPAGALSRGSRKGSELLYREAFFPLRKGENPFKKDQFSRPEWPLRLLCVQSADPAVLTGAGGAFGPRCGSNYNHAFHLNPSLAEAATCASDMRSCFCFSYFLSWQVSGCPLLALSSPPVAGKGRVCTSDIRHRVKSAVRELEVVGRLAFTTSSFLFYRWGVTGLEK